MDLVRHDDGQLLEPVRSVTEEGIRPFRGGHNDIELFECRVDGVVIPHAYSDLHSKLLELLQVLVLLRGECAKRDDIERLHPAKEGSPDRDVGDDGFYGRCW